MMLGGWWDGNNHGQDWSGIIDNIKVYNYAKADFSDRFNKKILWNRLGSDSSTIKSEFGPYGTIFGTITHGGGKYGNGVCANKTTNSVTYPLFAQDSKKFGTDQLTVEFWAKSWNVNQTNRYLFDLAVGRNVPSGDIHFVQQGATGFSVGGAAVNNAVVTGHTWVHNVLNHYAVTVSKTGVKVYINGKEKYSSPLHPEVIGQSIPHVLTLCGNGLTMSSNKWNGVIDNLKVYNYPKTDFSDRWKE